MMYKILLVIYVGLLLGSVSGLFKKYDPKPVEKIIKNSGLGATCFAYFIVSLFISIPLMNLYVQSYYLSPSLQWLSVLQLVLAFVGIIKSAFIPSYIKDGKYKQNKLWHVFMVGLDFYYLYLILTVIN